MNTWCYDCDRPIEECHCNVRDQELSTSSRPYCPVHNDPGQFEMFKHPTIPGWLHVRCKVCGTFLGNRPENLPKRGKKEAASQLLSDVWWPA